MPNARQNFGQFTRVYFYTTAQRAQMRIQHLQGFSNEFKVLQGAIGL